MLTESLASSQRKLGHNPEFNTVNAMFKKIKASLDETKLKIMQVSDVQKTKQKSNELEQELLDKMLKHDLNCTGIRKKHQEQLISLKSNFR
jgi:hypothetical protein